jgi:mannosyltransferase OCH1-like enzyme
MIVHQIFLKVSDKTFDDYPCYAEGMAKWKTLCEEQGWEYKLHTDIDKRIMNEYELDFLDKIDKIYHFSRVDYYRYILLSYYGGMYIDLDVEPTDKFKIIMNNDIIIGRTPKKTGRYNCYHANGNVIKLPKQIANELKQYSHSQYDEKIKIEVYKNRIKRFHLLVVGPNMLHKFCRTKKISFLLDFDEYFLDHSTMAWDKSMR